MARADASWILWFVLILRHAQEGVPVRFVVGEGVFLRQDRFGGFADVAGEVRNVAVVRHAVVVDLEAELVAAVFPFEAQAVAVVVILAVVGEVVEIEFPLDVREEEAELVPHHHAALRHDAGREGVVVVRRDVEVVRHREIDASGRAHPVGGRQEARTALIADREGEPGRPENGHALKVQGRARAARALVVLVDFELVHADEPGLVVAAAGRDGDVLHRGGVAREELDVLGAAAKAAGGVLPLGVGHFARARGDAEKHRRAREARALTGDAGVAVRPDGVVGVAVGDPVRRKDRAAASDLRVAVEMQFVVGRSFHAVGFNEAGGVVRRSAECGIERPDGIEFDSNGVGGRHFAGDGRERGGQTEDDFSGAERGHKNALESSSNGAQTPAKGGRAGDSGYNGGRKQ